MNVEPDICPVCDRMPCYGISMGPDYLTVRYEYRAATGNGNGSVRFYLYNMYIREVYGVLGRCVRVELSEYMEKFIKSSFPNEDGADYVGFAESDTYD